MIGYVMAVAVQQVAQAGWDTVAALQNWQIISALLLPLAISLLTTALMPKAAKVAIAFVVSLLFTLVKLYAGGEFAGGVDLVTTVLKVGALTSVFYELTWKPVGLAPWLEGISTRNALARSLSFDKARAAWSGPPIDQDDPTAARMGVHPTYVRLGGKKPPA